MSFYAVRGKNGATLSVIESDSDRNAWRRAKALGLDDFVDLQEVSPERAKELTRAAQLRGESEMNLQPADNRSTYEKWDEKIANAIDPNQLIFPTATAKAKQGATEGEIMAALGSDVLQTGSALGGGMAGKAIAPASKVIATVAGEALGSVMGLFGGKALTGETADPVEVAMAGGLPMVPFARALPAKAKETAANTYIWSSGAKQKQLKNPERLKGAIMQNFEEGNINYFGGNEAINMNMQKKLEPIFAKMDFALENMTDKLDVERIRQKAYAEINRTVKDIDRTAALKRIDDHIDAAVGSMQSGTVKYPAKYRLVNEGVSQTEIPMNTQENLFNQEQKRLKDAEEISKTFSQAEQTISVPQAYERAKIKIQNSDLAPKRKAMALNQLEKAKDMYYIAKTEGGEGGMYLPNKQFNKMPAADFVSTPRLAENDIGGKAFYDELQQASNSIKGNPVELDPLQIQSDIMSSEFPEFSLRTVRNERTSPAIDVKNLASGSVWRSNIGDKAFDKTAETANRSADKAMYHSINANLAKISPELRGLSEESAPYMMLKDLASEDMGKRSAFRTNPLGGLYDIGAAMMGGVLGGKPGAVAAAVANKAFTTKGGAAIMYDAAKLLQGSFDLSDQFFKDKEYAALVRAFAAEQSKGE